MFYFGNHEGVLLNCLVQDENDKILKEFHVGDYGGHLYWKSTADKILRASYYWPSFFSAVKKFVVSCHKCQIFEGKRKLLPLPLKPISAERPFQQWGLDFIGEIHPSSSGQHKWILTTTDYFTKWIEAIPCRQANDSIIMKFLETNILSRFGCPEKIITDNVATFKSKIMINFCHKHHITLGHSTTYYPQGNGLAESSNKILINIIKKVLEENKKNWHKKLELQAEPNDVQRRINQTIYLQQSREEVYQRTQVLQDKLKNIFDKRTKAEDFFIGDKALKWDSRREDKGKHGKFDFMWKGPYVIQAVQGNNTYCLRNLDATVADEVPINGRILKHYFDPPC
eukprot:PITA_20383